MSRTVSGTVRRVLGAYAAMWSGDVRRRFSADLKELTRVSQGAWERASRYAHDRPIKFARATAFLLEEDPASSGSWVAVKLLQRLQLHLALLADPEVVNLQASIALARLVAAEQPCTASALLRLVKDSTLGPFEASRGIRIRMMDVLAALPPSAGLLPPIGELLHSNDSQLRSRAVLVAARYMPGLELARLVSGDPDTRVRANGIEILWRLDGNEVIEAYQAALADPAHRVVANALVGLCLAGVPEGIRKLRSMAASGDWRARSAAAWAMGYLGDAAFLEDLQALREDASIDVRRNVLRGIVRIRSGASDSEVATVEAGVEV